MTDTPAPQRSGVPFSAWYTLAFLAGWYGLDLVEAAWRRFTTPRTTPTPVEES